MMIALALLVLIVALPMAGTVYVYEAFFGQRTDSSGHPTTPTIEEYPDLDPYPIQFSSNRGQRLRGYIYSSKTTSSKPKGLIVLSHGLGGGHLNYLEDINYFAEHGFWVLGFDNTGCNESEGKGMIGLSQSAIDLAYALRYAEQNNKLKELPRLLYGHSWGGHAVCSVLYSEHDVAAVVSLAGFNRAQDMLVEYGKNIYGQWIRLLSPFISLYERFKFGEISARTGEEGLRNSSAAALILHGEEDNVISLDASIYRHFRNTREPRITAVLLPGIDHYIMVSTAASEYNKTKTRNLKDLASKYGGRRLIPLEELDAFYEALDKSRSRELDSQVMNGILNFFEEAVK